jgi:hypothetical protein
VAKRRVSPESLEELRRQHDELLRRQQLEEPTDIAARLEYARRTYEASVSVIDRRRWLLIALHFCGPFRPLPEWLFRALVAVLAERLPQEPSRHEVRWMTVWAGRQKDENDKVPSLEEAYKAASKQLAGTKSAGSKRTIKASYLIVEKQRRRRQSRQRPS